MDTHSLLLLLFALFLVFLNGFFVAAEFALVKIRLAGHFAVLAADARRMNEVHALEEANLRQLTRHNDTLLAEMQLATTEDFQ